MVPMIAVISSNVAAIGYDRLAEDLYVRFHHAHRLYVYAGVRPWVYEEFLRAPSKGQFLMSEVRGRYPHRLVA
jgi:hypothetical protein